MNKNTINNNTERVQVAVKNVAFCMVILLVISVSMFSSANAADNAPVVYRANVGKITIEVDPRVELISIVFRLAGNPELTTTFRHLSTART